MSDWYFLHDDKSFSLAVTDNEKMQAYAQFENPDIKFVARDEIGNKVVSTVFLGLDHSFIHGEPPVLFETMVFNGDGDGGDCWRYHTYEEAMAGHRKACDNLTTGLTREELEASRALIEALLKVEQ